MFRYFPFKIYFFSFDFTHDVNTMAWSKRTDPCMKVLWTIYILNRFCLYKIYLIYSFDWQLEATLRNTAIRSFIYWFIFMILYELFRFEALEFLKSFLKVTKILKKWVKVAMGHGKRKNKVAYSPNISSLRSWTLSTECWRSKAKSLKIIKSPAGGKSNGSWQ